MSSDVTPLVLCNAWLSLKGLNPLDDISFSHRPDDWIKYHEAVYKLTGGDKVKTYKLSIFKTDLQWIPIIKTIRWITKLGLIDAKDYVDDMRVKGFGILHLHNLTVEQVLELNRNGIVIVETVK